MLLIFELIANDSKKPKRLMVISNIKYPLFKEKLLDENSLSNRFSLKNINIIALQINIIIENIKAYKIVNLKVSEK
ncbi:hypothetical protein [Clostridium grantii]|uniref:hypothetical protein n=1 Tax=Clostridium grantii TaxID=40575 RepID=UPI001FA910C0|nr:hypothetical protein [Clostridium grantii]